MKIDPNQFYTIAPVKATEPINVKPDFIRLPKPASVPMNRLPPGANLNSL